MYSLIRVEEEEVVKRVTAFRTLVGELADKLEEPNAV